MNRKRWLLVVLFVGCGNAVPTMTVAVTAHTFNSTTNGQGLVTIGGTEHRATFAHGPQDPEGFYPYVVTAFVVPDVPTGTYTGTVSLMPIVGGVQPTEMELLGSCTVVVDALAGTNTCVWFDGTLPPGGGGGPGDPGGP